MIFALGDIIMRRSARRQRPDQTLTIDSDSLKHLKFSNNTHDYYRQFPLEAYTIDLWCRPIVEGLLKWQRCHILSKTEKQTYRRFGSNDIVLSDDNVIRFEVS